MHVLTISPRYACGGGETPRRGRVSRGPRVAAEGRRRRTHLGGGETRGGHATRSQSRPSCRGREGGGGLTAGNTQSCPPALGVPALPAVADSAGVGPPGVASPAVSSAHGCQDPFAVLHEGRPSMGIQVLTTFPRYTWQSRMSAPPAASAFHWSTGQAKGKKGNFSFWGGPGRAPVRRRGGAGGGGGGGRGSPKRSSRHPLVVISLTAGRTHASPDSVVGTLGEASPAGAAGAASSSEAAHCCHDPSATRQEGLPNMSMHSFRTSPR